MPNRLLESGKDRRVLVADAGIRGVSFTSLIAGVLVAYGAFAVLVAIAAAITSAVGIDTDLTTNWESLGTAGGLTVALILFLSYLFGGYVAGRMARRSGVVHGLLVAALGVAIVAGVAAIVRQAADAQGVVENLRALGLPTTADEYGNAGTVAGIASLLAILVGALCGGSMGERWHGVLLTRAVDPSIGPEAEALRLAQEQIARSNAARSGSIAAGRAEAGRAGNGRAGNGHAGDGHAGDGDADGDGVDDHGDRPWGWRRGEPVAGAGAGATAGTDRGELGDEDEDGAGPGGRWMAMAGRGQGADEDDTDGAGVDDGVPTRKRRR